MVKTSHSPSQENGFVVHTVLTGKLEGSYLGLSSFIPLIFLSSQAIFSLSTYTAKNQHRKFERKKILFWE
jgi:hypothetical protein